MIMATVSCTYTSSVDLFSGLDAVTTCVVTEGGCDAAVCGRVKSVEHDATKVKR